MATGEAGVRRWSGFVAGVSAVTLALTGCTSGATDVPTPGPLAQPAGLSLEVDGDSHLLRFGTDPSASAYLLEVDELRHPVPVETCDDTSCAIGVEGLLGSDERELRVVAMDDFGATATSTDAVVLPATPSSEAGEPEDSGAIAVVRRGGDDTFVTESVPVADAAAGRELLAELAADPDVEVASWDVPVAPLRGAVAPTVPLAQGTGLVEQGAWHLGVLGLLGPDLPLGDGAGVTVAVIDSGIDADHPGLRGRVLPGVSLVDPSADGTTRPGFHGTGVASLIVGSSPAYGVAPGARVLPIDAHGGQAAWTAERMISGIVHAVDAGADIINISAGANCGGGTAAACTDGIDWAVRYAERNGVLVVAAAGNNGAGRGCDEPTGQRLWPAALALAVAVGASDLEGRPWVCSADIGDTDLLAPGAGLPIYRPTGNGPITGVGSGTSGAAPIVAGIAARLLSDDPSLTPAALRLLLTQGGHARGRVISLTDVLTERDRLLGVMDPDATLGTGRYLWELEVDGRDVWDLQPRPEFDPGHAEDAQRTLVQGYLDVADDGTVTGRGYGAMFGDTTNHFGESLAAFVERHLCAGSVQLNNEADVTGSVDADGVLTATLDFEIIEHLGRVDCPGPGDRAAEAHQQDVTRRIAAVLDRLEVTYDLSWPIAPVLEHDDGYTYRFEVLRRRWSALPGSTTSGDPHAGTVTGELASCRMPGTFDHGDHELDAAVVGCAPEAARTHPAPGDP